MSALAASDDVRVLEADPESIAVAVDALAAGEIVALPTETVYGLAADATDGEAVARIFAAKGRPRFNPMIAHVDTMDMARRVARFDPTAERLAASFWPGPLTLVLPLHNDSDIHPLVTAGLDTVAMRMPRGIARSIISQLGRPLAAPSANRSGSISATTAHDVLASLGAAAPLVLDAGRTGVGLESTIVSVDGDTLTCLRPGGVPVEEIEKVAGASVRRARAGDRVTAPGMLASHYAPDMPVRLDTDEVRKGEALLAFGHDRAAGWRQAATCENLSPTGDLTEAASNLFAMLHRLNAARPRAIAVEPIPKQGLGEAINDRLARAAAPRGQP